MTTPQPPSLVFVEHVLWTPGDDWTSAVRHLEARFARAHPLDADAVLAAPALHDQVALLDAWAGTASVDLGKELGRWFDEHLSMHVRPAPAITRAVRALAASGPVHAATALPAPAAEAIARHAGCWRSFAQLHDSIGDADALALLVGQLEPSTVVAAAPTPVPAGTTTTALTSAAGAHS